jgi:DNA repair protein RadA/Sms
VFGEVGLAGEVRGITQAARRVREAVQMGFGRCVLPRGNLDAPGTGADGCELVGVANLGEALDALFA